MKIQTKTTLLFTILTATIFVLLNVTVYFFINAFAHRDFNKRLELRARISSKYRFEKDKVSTQAFSELQRQYLERLPEEMSFIVRTDSLQTALLPPQLQQLPASYLQEMATAGGNTVYYQTHFRHFAGFRFDDAGRSYLVIGSATNQYGLEMMRQLRWIKFLSVAVCVLLIYTVGMYFSRKTFQPFRELIQRVKEISQGNLHLRLKPREGSDEIAELTATFNEMLNRLETAFETQNNFISHASHELRTPLTAIIGEAELALSRERTPEAYQQSLQLIVKQAEKLQSLSKGLLALAQTGFNGKTQTWSPIRLDELLFEVKEDCDAINPGCTIRIRMEGLPADERELSIDGNYPLLKTAINNVVLNACKYSRNQPVDLNLYCAPDALMITVQDRGIGIPGNELKYIYDPFFRASNTLNYEGYGIGMPLSYNIIQLHKGKIDVHSELGVGTIVKISLPKKD